MWSSISGRIRSSSAHCVARSIALAVGMLGTATILIPDYPRGVDIYEAITGCGGAPTEWLHEILALWALVAFVVFGSILWQAITTWRNVGILLGSWLERIEKDL